MESTATLTQYVRDLLGEQIALNHVPRSELRGVPAHVAGRYRVHSGALLGVRLHFAKLTLQDRTPSQAAKDLEILRGRLGTDVVLVFDRMASWERQRFIKAAIPFIVPGYQMFLPMLRTDLREQFPARHRYSDPGAHVSWAAQVALLRHLQSGGVVGSTLQELAALLGYSAMTMTNVLRELEHRGLCIPAISGRAKSLIFPSPPRDLWISALPFLRSPVRRSMLLERCGARLPASGLSALASRTDIEAGPIPCYAANLEHSRALLANGSIAETLDPDGAVATLEIWNYDPNSTSADKRIVDSLSLHLSLAGDPDERVQAALATIMEHLKWSAD